MTDAPSPKKDPKDYRFQPGNPGKPKGVKHRLKESFWKALTSDFEANGAEAIVAAREKDPLGYLRVIASVLPQQIDIKNASNQMTDAELISVIRNSVPADDATDEGAIH